MARKLSVTALQELIVPHTERFRKSLWPVWKSYESSIPERIRLQLDATTEANILHDLAVGNIKKEFSGDIPGIQIVDGNSFFIGIDGLALGIDGQVACRIKKMDLRGHSRNYPTETAKGIRRNDPESMELELSDATIVDIGWVLDPLGAGFLKIQAVRLYDESFVLEIPREKGGVISMPSPLHGPEGDRGRAKRFEISSRKEESGPDPKAQK